MKRIDFWRETLGSLSREQRALIANAVGVYYIIDAIDRRIGDSKLRDKLLDCITKIFDEWWEEEVEFIERRNGE